MSTDVAHDPQLAERVERLWAIEEIKNVALTYSIAVDTCDWPLMESL